MSGPWFSFGQTIETEMKFIDIKQHMLLLQIMMPKLYEVDPSNHCKVLTKEKLELEKHVCN